MKRKSIEEKLAIVKSAKSKTKIKKLSIQLSITTKTIKKWISQYENGELGYDIAHKNSSCKPHNVFDHSKIKSFNNIVFNITKLPPPFKNHIKGRFFRFQIKDIDHNFIFSSYSTSIEEDVIRKFLDIFIQMILQSGYSIKKLITNKKSLIVYSKKIFEKYNIKLELSKHTDIKKHQRFSLRKNSYIKNRTIYENHNDFLFDSLATVSKNNNIIIEEKNCKHTNLICFLNKMNILLHSTIVTSKNAEYDRKKILDVILDKYRKALEFQKRYDLVNSDYIYEKICLILNRSNLEKELSMKVFMQRGKIYGLKKQIKESEFYLKEALNILKLLNKDETTKFEYEKDIYMIYADINRMNVDFKKCNYYLKKVRIIVTKINKPETTALFLLNYGLMFKNFKKINESTKYFTESKKIALENNLSNLLPSIEESIAGNYLFTGNYYKAKKIFEQIVKDEFYSDQPYHQALLYAKLADTNHLLGNLTNSIKLYNHSLNILGKNIELKVFLQLHTIVSANKAFSLIKMGKLNEAKEIYADKLKISKLNNFKEQVLENLANLSLTLVDMNNIKVSEKYLKELNIMLKNIENPSVKYRYYLAYGMIYTSKKLYSTAKKYFNKSIKESEKAGSNNSSKIRCLFELANLYIKINDFKNAKNTIKIILNSFIRQEHPSMFFHADLLMIKTHFFSKNNKENYREYLLKSERNLILSEEQNYIIKREIKLL